MTTTLTCVHCGVSFTVTNQAARGGRKYCGSACYRAREMINGPRKLVEPVKFTCKQCGAPFERDPGELRSYRNKHGKDPMYCSTKCGGIGRRNAQVKTCKNCGGAILRRDTGGGRTRTVCSQDCRRALKKKQMVAYHADRIPVARPTRHGYMRLTIEGKEILEHRRNMEDRLGRKLLPSETVHHINGNRSDNRLENLELFCSRHGPGQRVHEQVAWALDLIQTYPEFAREAGYVLTPIATPLDDLFNEGAATDKAH